MPLKAFKCIVDLTIHMVSAPGVRLANKDDLYLNVCLLGQQRRTRLTPAAFPLIFDDHLVFEKTFKFCRDPSDVVNLLRGQHVFIELIQLGRFEDSEILANYEASVKDFLYPFPEFKIIYHTAQRDLFMTPSDDFPGSISPQLEFCTSTKIEETRTPSLDILKEYEQRFIYDPLIDIKSTKNKMKKNGTKSAKYGKSYRDHTISSAIKADYGKTDVRTKLSEINSTVDSRVEDNTTKLLHNEFGLAKKSKNPFVVGRVHEKLIGRSPSAHKILNDGLILTRKSRDRSQKRTKSSQVRKNFSTQNKSANRSHSLERSQSLKNKHQSIRLARSHSPSLNRENQFQKEHEGNVELNDTSKLYSSIKKYDTTLENCDLCSNKHHNCDVCVDYSYRTGQSYRGNKFHRDETRLGRVSPLFDGKDPFTPKSAIELRNEERYLNTSEYLRRSYNALKDKYKDRYPLNNSFSYYAPPLSRYDWKYSKLYPWYYTYTDYLRELEDELYWLKLRSRMVYY